MLYSTHSSVISQKPSSPIFNLTSIHCDELLLCTHKSSVKTDQSLSDNFESIFISMLKKIQVPDFLYKVLKKQMEQWS